LRLSGNIDYTDSMTSYTMIEESHDKTLTYLRIFIWRLRM